MAALTSPRVLVVCLSMAFSPACTTAPIPIPLPHDDAGTTYAPDRGGVAKDAAAGDKAVAPYAEGGSPKTDGSTLMGDAGADARTDGQTEAGVTEAGPAEAGLKDTGAVDKGSTPKNPSPR